VLTRSPGLTFLNPGRLPARSQNDCASLDEGAWRHAPMGLWRRWARRGIIIDGALAPSDQAIAIGTDRGIISTEAREAYRLAHSRGGIREPTASLLLAAGAFLSPLTLLCSTLLNRQASRQRIEPVRMRSGPGKPLASGVSGAVGIFA